MPGRARHKVIREGEIATYHAYSRFRGGDHLMGVDPITGRDYSYLRERTELLFGYLARLFLIDIGGYNVLSNHLHTVLRSRPDRAAKLAEVDVVCRYKMAWPHFDEARGQWICTPTDAEINKILCDPVKLEEARARLSSVSWFMARLKRTLSAEINRARNESGTCWAGRFGCRELVDDPAVLGCMLYVDLNQVKAGMADSLLESRYSSIQARIVEHRLKEAKKAAKELRKFEAEGVYISPDEVKQLYLNCSWLAPVSAKGPLKLINDAWQARTAPGKIPEPLPTLDPQPTESPDHSPLILPAHYQIDGSANSNTKNSDTKNSDTKNSDNGDSNSNNGDSSDGNRNDADDHAKCPVPLGPHPATAAALAELLPNLRAALGRPAADRRGKTSTESGPADQVKAPEDQRQPTGPAHPDILPNAASFQAELVRSTADGNSSQSGSLNVQQSEANDNLRDGSPSGSPPDPESQPNSQPDSQPDSWPDPKSLPDPGADPEAKPKPARRSGRTGPSPKPRPRKQRKPATYAIYNEFVQRLPMRASDDPILGMPIEQYLEIAEVAAADTLGKRRASQGEVVHPTSLPVKIIMWLTAMGINAANWFNTLDRFEQLFHRVVGTPENLEKYCERTGRKRVGGMKACREAFSGPPPAESPRNEQRARDVPARDSPDTPIAPQDAEFS